MLNGLSSDIYRAIAEMTEVVCYLVLVGTLQAKIFSLRR